MYIRFFLICISSLFFVPIFAQKPAYSNHSSAVRKPHDFQKVKDRYHPDTAVVLENIFLGKLPVTWVNNSIGKKKMTAAMMGGDILYLNASGTWEAYASYIPDLSLLQKHLSQKSKFTLVEKLYIETGPEAYQSGPPKGKSGEISNPVQEGEKIYVDANLPGISEKRFRVTYVTDTLIIICSDDEKLTTFIVQVN